MPTDQEIEQEIQAKGKTAPRVTLDDIEAAIASEHYFTAGEGWADALHNGGYGVYPHPGSLNRPDPLDRLTFCVFVLKNGFTVTGESACVSPENFDAELGRKIARQKAIDEMWVLMGFALAERLKNT